MSLITISLVTFGKCWWTLVDGGEMEDTPLGSRGSTIASCSTWLSTVDDHLESSVSCPQRTKCSSHDNLTYCRQIDPKAPRARIKLIIAILRPSLPQSSRDHESRRTAGQTPELPGDTHLSHAARSCSH